MDHELAAIEQARENAHYVTALEEEQAEQAREDARYAALTAERVETPSGYLLYRLDVEGRDYWFRWAIDREAWVWLPHGAQTTVDAEVTVSDSDLSQDGALPALVAARDAA